MPGLVGRERHRAAERVDLLDQMPLADAADRGIAAHLPQRLDVMREQQRAPPHARGRERRLGAGVAAADHDHVIVSCESHAPEPLTPRTKLRRTGAKFKPAGRIHQRHPEPTIGRSH